LKIAGKRTQRCRKNRSDFIETAIETFIEPVLRDEQHAKDLEILNRRAAVFSREAAGVPAYQMQL
jgi:hypothetical protein